MRKSPVTVQQWVNALPQNSTPVTPNIPTNSPAKPNLRLLGRDLSLQSDDASSHCSSVESVLELRKPDPEAVLLGLGFGPPYNINHVSRIPQRFLQPSRLLRNIDFNKFLEQQGQIRCEQVLRGPSKHQDTMRPYTQTYSIR